MTRRGHRPGPLGALCLLLGLPYGAEPLLPPLPDGPGYEQVWGRYSIIQYLREIELLNTVPKNARTIEL
jgi:hypothetical protein